MNTTFPFIYKFKGRFPAVVMLCLVAGLCVLLAVVDFRQRDGTGGVIFCIGAALFFLLLGEMFLLGKANIVVDDESISRTFLGKQIKVIQWKDVERITVFLVRGAGVSSNVTGYNIIATKKRSDLSNTKRISFGNQGNDLSELIRCMNICIARFNIKVERLADGATIVVKSI